MPPLAVLGADATIDAIIVRLQADSGSGGVSALTNGRIYRGAPDIEGPAYPIVTVSLMSDADPLTAQDGEHVWSNIVALVKITDVGQDYSRVYAIAKRLVSRLDQYGPITQDGVYISALRYAGSPAQDPDFRERRRYMYHNSLWQCEAQPA